MFLGDDDELKIDSGADDDFEDIDDSIHNRYIINPNILQPQTQPYIQTSNIYTIFYKILILIFIIYRTWK